MFERFTRDARLAVVAAQEVARGLDDSAIRATHLLVGLADPARPTGDLLTEHQVDRDALVRWVSARHRGGLDESALSTIGIDLTAIRTSVESTFGPGALDYDPPTARRRPFGRRRPTVPGRNPFTDGARKSLELSLREAIRLGLGSIGSGAILLGVLRSDDVEVRHVLNDLGADRDALRRATEAALRRAA